MPSSQRLFILCLLFFSVPLSWCSQVLTVYTALEANQLRAYQRAFNNRYPDIRIQWVRNSTGITTAKLLAEKNHPIADVIWGLPAANMATLMQQGLLAPYAPKDLDKLNPDFYDRHQPPHWIGMDVWTTGLCINRHELKKHQLPMPTAWGDLAKPIYQQHIVMPNPQSSGTGYLALSAWLQIFGEQTGWQYIDKLHKNIQRYTHSGSGACQLAATGEATIGISLTYRGATLIQQGAPLSIVLPSEGIGWDMEAAAIIKGTDKWTAATQLIDFAASFEANELYSNAYPIVAIPEASKRIPHYPPNIEKALITRDFTWLAAHRTAIIDQWATRYRQ